MITYGDLKFKQLPVDFAHYTMRRGRAKRIHSPLDMPDYLWSEGPMEDDYTYFYLTQNADLTIAPTKNDEVKYPITAKMKFKDVAQMGETMEALLAQGLEFTELTMDGSVTIEEDGNSTVFKDEEPEPVKEVKEVPGEPEIDKPFKPKKKKGRITIPSDKFFEMIDLNIGDRIRVYDSHGYECDQYVLVMSMQTIPKLRNTRTKLEIDLFYILDLEYEIVKRGASFNES